ncbi:MAG: YggT family protein [Chloroflexales bacterium]
MIGFIGSFINILLNILVFAIFGRVVLSWIDPMGNMRVTQILNEITDPILAPLRSALPQMGMIDLSPMVAILLIEFLNNMLHNVIR